MASVSNPFMIGNAAGEFGGAFIKVLWQDDQLRQNLANGEAATRGQANVILAYYAPQIEGDMRASAPWTDRTGNARNGLAARAYDEGEETGIVLFGQVPYQIWLEVRWSGRYAIIVPSIEKWGPIVMDGMRDMLTQMRF